jgi:predicted SnoaL-like aldol condensation-catalyzing enzyme
MTTTAVGTHKDIAIAFLQACAAGNARDAFVTYGTTDFVHHNPFYDGDAMSIALGMEENVKKFPDKVFAVQRALEDGDVVAVHSRVQMRPGDRGIAVVHILRFAGDRIAEMWDIAQEVPEKSVNRMGMF